MCTKLLALFISVFFKWGLVSHCVLLEVAFAERREDLIIILSAHTISHCWSHGLMHMVVADVNLFV